MNSDCTRPGCAAIRRPNDEKTAQEPKVTDNPLYHDTWMLLRKYRDVVWSLELSVQQVRRQFQIEYGSSIEEFLESLYVAGVTFEGSAIEDHARCIERSYKMLKLLDTSVELLRTKHKYGESFYWLLYYTYLSPQQLANTQEIIENWNRTSAISATAPTSASVRWLLMP